MKIIFTSILILISIHKGGTDSRGGHNDNINGGYHYHHGCAAHSHSGGCIYNYEDCEREYSYSNYDSSDDTPWWQTVLVLYLVIWIGYFIWDKTVGVKDRKYQKEIEKKRMLEYDEWDAKREEDKQKKRKKNELYKTTYEWLEKFEIKTKPKKNILPQLEELLRQYSIYIDIEEDKVKLVSYCNDLNNFLIDELEKIQEDNYFNEDNIKFTKKQQADINHVVMRIYKKTNEVNRLYKS